MADHRDGPRFVVSPGLTFPIGNLKAPEVRGFGHEEPPAAEFTEEQVQRAAASLRTFCETLPEDERAVITHVLSLASVG